MKKIRVKEFLASFLIMVVIVSTGEAQATKKSVKNPEKAMFGRSLHTKDVKVREPRSVTRAKKKQEAVKKKQKNEYSSLVKKNRKRSVEIQSPEVQSRMKENMKNSDNNYKIKKKQIKAGSRKTGKKFR